MEFCIRLAGHAIGIKAIHDSTREFCREYICDETPEFIVEILESDISFERKKSANEAIVEGKNIIQYSDMYLETLAVYRKIVNKLIDYNIILFHGSVIAVDGKAYLFTAKSGTGKSTHTRIWRKIFGDRAVMVNDDKPLLQIMDKKVISYGTPWDGKHRLSNNISVPLKAICILERGAKNIIKRVTFGEAVGMLYQQVNRPKDAILMQATMALISKMTENVELYRLRCNMDDEAAIVAYEGMNGGTLG